jgi:hypothetical protein
MANEPQQSLLLCQKCNSSLLAEDCFCEQGDLQSYRCKKCGIETHVMVCRTVSLPPIDKWYSLRACWQHAKPSLTELHTLRKLHESFRAMTIVDLKSRLSSQSIIDFGKYSFGEASEIQQQAAQMGLGLEVHELPRQS